MLRMIVTASIVGLTGAALADTLELDLPGSVERQSVTYSCSDGVERTAEYINVGQSNSLALIEIEGETLVFVNVLSGSGARYAARQYIWWDAQNAVTFTDETAGEGAKPVTCQEKKA